MTTSVALSAVFRADQSVGGVYSVFENLARGMSVVCADPHTAGAYDVTVFHTRPEIPDECAALHWRQVRHRFGRFATEARIALQHGAEFDGLLCLNYFTPPIVRAARAVTIIHDLQYVHLPELCPPRKRLWLKACHAVTLRKCHRVVAISQAVRQDILKQYGEKWSDRVDVIWNPVSFDRFDGGGGPSLTGGRPYIFCVGVDRPQKNLFRLVQAFHRLADQFPDHVLVIAGQVRSLLRLPREQSADAEHHMPPTTNLVEQLGLAGRVRITGFVSDEQLGNLYRGADVCVLPSLFEGFGMTAVESLGMGCATLVSDLPVLREVTMNSAHYFADPRDVGGMADAIGAILRNPSAYKPDAPLSGRIRESFSPRNIARQYLELFRA
jgi:glycosyltransferase involved in cell wall biosynthesis